MAAPPVTCRRKTPAYATSTPAYSFWQRRNLGTRTTSNRRPRRTPILLTPTCHKPRIPTIAHLQLRTIAQFQRIGTLTAQESTDNRGNGSQASEQLRPLPNLARPVTPTTSCEAPLLFDFTDSCSCWPGPAPRTHQTRMDGDRRPSPSFSANIPPRRGVTPTKYTECKTAPTTTILQTLQSTRTEHQHSALHTHSHRPTPHRQTHPRTASAADESSASAPDTLDSTRPHMRDTRTHLKGECRVPLWTAV